MAIWAEEAEALSLQVIAQRAVQMFARCKASYKKEILSPDHQIKYSILVAARTYRDDGRFGSVILLVDDANDLAYGWIEETCDLGPRQRMGKSVDVWVVWCLRLLTSRA